MLDKMFEIQFDGELFEGKVHDMVVTGL